MRRGRTDGADVDDAVRAIAETADLICAERLTPSLPWLGRHLETHGALTTSPQLLEQWWTLPIA
jgi:hypothetical protein